MTVYSNAWQPDPSSWAPVGESAQIPGPGNSLGQNWNRCRDPLLDRAFAAGESTLVQPQRRTAYLQAQQRWLDDHCTIPLFEWPEVDQVSHKLHNFAPNPSLSMDIWNAADWWVSG
jgi:ABC-type transport system substrate-binding protein